MLNRAEHEKSFITSGPDFVGIVIKYDVCHIKCCCSVNDFFSIEQIYSLFVKTEFLPLGFLFISMAVYWSNITTSTKFDRKFVYGKISRIMFQQYMDS